MNLITLIATVIAIISSIVTIINIMWLFVWKRKTREEDKRIKNFETNYKIYIDKSKKEMEIENQKYIEELNDKKELLELVDKFTRLSYSTLMKSIAMLYEIKLDLESLKNKNSKIESIKLAKFINKHFEIKEGLHILKKDTSVLYSYFGETDITILIGGSYNELYFLNDFIEIQILKHVKNHRNNNDKIIQYVNKALKSSDDLRKTLDGLETVLLNKLNEFYPAMQVDGPTFIKGTELFNWYYPEHPFEVEGIHIEKGFTEKDLIDIAKNMKNKN